MTELDSAQPKIEFTHRYYVDEDSADNVWDDELDRIDNPIDASGVWEVVATATISLGRGESPSYAVDSMPMSLSEIGLATAALKEAMLTFDPPVVLSEWDSRIELDSSYDDEWNPGVRGSGGVNRYKKVHAKFEQRFEVNQDVPTLTGESPLPALELGIDF